MTAYSSIVRRHQQIDEVIIRKTHFGARRDRRQREITYKQTSRRAKKENRFNVPAKPAENETNERPCSYDHSETNRTQKTDAILKKLKEIGTVSAEPMNSRPENR